MLRHRTPQCLGGLGLGHTQCLHLLLELYICRQIQHETLIGVAWGGGQHVQVRAHASDICPQVGDLLDVLGAVCGSVRASGRHHWVWRPCKAAPNHFEQRLSVQHPRNFVLASPTGKPLSKGGANHRKQFHLLTALHTAGHDSQGWGAGLASGLEWWVQWLQIGVGGKGGDTAARFSCRMEWMASSYPFMRPRLTSVPSNFVEQAKGLR